METRTCREVLEEALVASGFSVRLLPPGPGLSLEAGTGPEPRFQIEVIPPGVLPGEAFYREAGGYRIRYRQAPGAVPSEEERARLLRTLDALPGRIRAAIPLGVDLPGHGQDSRETGTTRWLEVGGGRCRELLLRVEFRCNQACPFCFVRLGSRRLEPGDLPALLGPVLRPDEDQVVLTGGEPTIHPRFRALLQTLRNLGASRIGLQTNGVRFADPDRVREIRELGVQRLLVSFHSHRPEVYDRITGTRRQFHRAVQGLRNLAAEAPPLAITVNVVLNRLNLPDLPDLVGFVADILGPSDDAATFFLTMMNEVGHRKAPDLAVSLEEMGPALDRALEACRARSRTVDPFLGDCAPPPCILRDPTPVLPAPRDTAGMTPRTDIDYLDPGAPVSPAPDRRVKARDCRDCLHDPACHGIPPSLAARFGIEALRPLRPGAGPESPP